MTLAEPAAARSHNRSSSAPGAELHAALSAGETADPPIPHLPGASALAHDPDGFRRFQRDLQFLADHDDVIPTRMHAGGIEDGSALGSPALSKPWRLWLDAGERAVIVDRVEERCFHHGVPRSAICPSCAILDADGVAIGQSGVRIREVGHYRWPMRAALAKARRVQTPPGIPDPASVVWAILAAGAGFDGRPLWISAMWRLAHRYPALHNGQTMYDVARRSAAAVRSRFQYEAPARLLPRQKSDAQLDAEAAT